MRSVPNEDDFRNSINSVEELKIYYEAQKAKREAKAVKPFFWRFAAVVFGIGASVIFSLGLAVFSGFWDAFRDTRRDYITTSHLLSTQQKSLDELDIKYKETSQRLKSTTKKLSKYEDRLIKATGKLKGVEKKFIDLSSSLDGRRLHGVHFTLSGLREGITYGQALGPIIDSKRASDYLPPERPTVRLIILADGNVIYRVRTTKEDGKFIGYRTVFEDGTWEFDGKNYVIILLNDTEPILKLILSKRQIQDLEENKRNNLCFKAKVLSKLASTFPTMRAVCTDTITK